jgi:hypothetical protein
MSTWKIAKNVVHDFHFSYDYELGINGVEGMLDIGEI